MFLLGLLLAVAAITYFALKDHLRATLPREASIPDKPVGFGYKIVWLAVKTTNTQAVAAALADAKPQPCNWKTGIEKAYRSDGLFLFVTPPVDGWTLVVGANLADGDVQIIDRLSARFGEAQWFATHRVSDFHGWAKSIDGRIVRHYAYVGDQGETLHVEGEPTPDEPADLYDSRGPEQDAPFLPTQETVMRVAAGWSVDPTKLEGRDLPAATGLLLLLR